MAFGGPDHGFWKLSVNNVRGRIFYSQCQRMQNQLFLWLFIHISMVLAADVYKYLTMEKKDVKFLFKKEGNRRALQLSGYWELLTLWTHFGGYTEDFQSYRKVLL